MPQRHCSVTKTDFFVSSEGMSPHAGAALSRAKEWIRPEVQVTELEGWKQDAGGGVSRWQGRRWLRWQGAWFTTEG